MVRDDIPAAELEFNLKAMASFPVAIGGKYSYTVAFTEVFPEKFFLQGDGIEKYVHCYCVWFEEIEHTLIDSFAIL